MDAVKKLFTETMECSVVPSLEYQVHLRIARLLWSRKAFHYNEWPKWFESLTYGHLNKKLDLIGCQINRLPLPEMLKKELIRVSVAVGEEIFKWTEYHLNKYILEIRIPKPLRWNPSGTINYKKTAELLIQDLTIDIYPRFFLACMYGFEDSIREFWRALPQDLQSSLLYKDVNFIYYWANDLTEHRIEGPIEEELNRLFVESLPKSVFDASIRMCDPPVSDYFYHKLQPEEKLILPNLFEYIAKTICEQYPKHAQPKFVYTDVLCWLLHKLDEQQQEKMLKMYPFPVLLCYLEWPKQELFIEMAECLIKFLCKKHFVLLLKKIALKVARVKDFNYCKLFRQFWLQGSKSQKKHAMVSNSFWCALYHLFKARDYDTTAMIFAEANESQKSDFLNSRWGKRTRIYLNSIGERFI